MEENDEIIERAVQFMVKNWDRLSEIFFSERLNIGTTINVDKFTEFIKPCLNKVEILYFKKNCIKNCLFVQGFKLELLKSLSSNDRINYFISKKSTCGYNGFALKSYSSVLSKTELKSLYAIARNNRADKKNKKIENKYNTVPIPLTQDKTEVVEKQEEIKGDTEKMESNCGNKIEIDKVKEEKFIKKLTTLMVHYNNMAEEHQKRLIELNIQKSGAMLNQGFSGYTKWLDTTIEELDNLNKKYIQQQSQLIKLMELTSNCRELIKYDQYTKIAELMKAFAEAIVVS